MYEVNLLVMTNPYCLSKATQKLAEIKKKQHKESHKFNKDKIKKASIKEIHQTKIN
jgi:hypothetical protein